MKNILFLFSIQLMLLACTKQKGYLPPDNIKPGQVQFTFNNGYGLKQCLEAVSSTGTQNYELRNFYYTKTIPGDSMSYYFTLFKSCSYIKAFDIFRKPEDSFTRFRSICFPNLDLISYARWDSLVKREKITEMPDGGDGIYRNGMLYVTPGEEKIWIKKLEIRPEIKSADYVYNVYGNFQTL